MGGDKEFTKRVLEIDESVREIQALDDLYSDLIAATPKTQAEQESVKEQAKFARERILKLSLHIRHLLERVENKELL